MTVEYYDARLLDCMTATLNATQTVTYMHYITYAYGSLLKRLTDLRVSEVAVHLLWER